MKIKRPKIDFRLYFITAGQSGQGGDVVSIVELGVRAGIKAVQLREKDLLGGPLFRLAAQLRSICGTTSAKLFINDRVDAAILTECDGVQLTSRSLRTDVVRTKLNYSKLIGVSTHSLQEARDAQRNGADFVLFGPIFATPSKRAYGKPQGLTNLRLLCREVAIPVFAVGGISPERAYECIRNGAWGVAAISSIMNAVDLQVTLAEYKGALGSL